MPVVNPNIQIIKPSELRKFGAQVVITNSYIIYRKPELRERAMREGLHSLIGFDGPIMTDSGSYQLSIYGEVEVNNKQIVEFQVQGSTFSELRERSARELSLLDFDLYPLGAVVPLMESYRYSDLVDVIVASKKGLSPAAPVHLFGAGHPMMFSLAVALGCDLFDSASYALYAKDGRYMTSRGTYHIEQLQYLPCSCPICSSYNVRELMESQMREELLASHNLYVTFEEIREVKQAIHEGNLWELVEYRSRGHPKLLSGLMHTLSQHSEWIEEFQPLSRATFFYSGPESSLRPEVLRHKNKLKETYPLNAEVSDIPDHESLTMALQNLIELVKLNPGCEFTIALDDFSEHPLMTEIIGLLK